MSAAKELRRDVFKVGLRSLLVLFLVPALTLAFVVHVQSSVDAEVSSTIREQVAADPQLDKEERQVQLAYFESHPVSASCYGNAESKMGYNDEACARFSEVWQFETTRVVTVWMLALGAGTLLAIGILGGMAFGPRKSQYWSLVIGWHVLTVVMATEVLVQGSLLVWLSFWLTAWFFEIYIIKIILLVGLVAGAVALGVVAAIFRRPPMNNVVHGELLDETGSPALWQNVRALAQQMGTAPPDHIVAGIDANFFVTEAPLTVGERTITGRSLFVSLPLLRILERGEADAVLAHELAHLQGGDTAASAKLGPKLAQYDHYCGTTPGLVSHVMTLYRLILEWAMKQGSREREFRADKAAAEIVSPQGIVHSLVKIAAYSTYRGQVEQKLYQQKERHDATLAIARSVAEGLAPFSASSQFLDQMRSANVPHPFDSHPPLPERMVNVGCQLEEQAFGGLVSQHPADNWTVDIGSHAEIEQRLWQSYEAQFTAAHEQKLAYLYKPDTDEERALVERFFPPVSFALKKGKTVEISYLGIQLPGHEDRISWGSVVKLEYQDGYGGDRLEITHPEKSWRGAKTTKVTLYGIKSNRKAFKVALGSYWQRDQVMRKEAAQV